MGGGSKQTFLQRQTDGRKAHKKILTIANYQRNTNQNYVKCHLSLVRMAIIKKSTNKNAAEGLEKRARPIHCWWECKSVQPLWRTEWRFLKKLKILLPYDLASPLLGIYLQKVIQKGMCTPLFTAALFTIAKTWK